MTVAVPAQVLGLPKSLGQQVILAWLLFAVGAGVVAAVAPGARPWTFVGVVLLLSLHLGWLLWQQAPNNRASDAEQPRERLSLATWLTLSRGMVVTWLGGWIGSPPLASVWLVGCAYLFVALVDWLDGYVARRMRAQSVLGAVLDLRIDALGLLVAPLLAVRLGRLPGWYLVFAGAYFIYRLGIALRHRLRLPVYEQRIKPSMHTRMLAGFQMIFVGYALLPLASTRALAMAAALSMSFSLATFVRDWLVICGVVQPDSLHYRRLREFGLTVLKIYVPCVARATLALLLVIMAVKGGELLAPAWLAKIVWLSTAMVVAGVAARAFAVAACFVLSTIVDPSWPAQVWFLALVWIVLWGAGRSLWVPEDRYFYTRMG